MEQGILPSRKELLSRIELVCDLDSSLISVTGEAGIGKSALLEFFIEHHCHDLKKCFVGAEPNMAPYQIRESILSQLLPGCTFDSHLSLAQNLATLAPNQTFKGIFILDNAENVADEVFYDLIDLMDDGRYQFSVIYAQVRDNSRQADLNARKALIEIHPEPLDVAESKLLLQFYYGDMLDEDKSQVKSFIDDSEGIPANLLQWQQGAGASHANKAKKAKQAKKVANTAAQKNSGKNELGVASDSKNKGGNKLLIILGGGFLLTVLAVAGWYFKPPSQQDIKAQLRAKLEQQQTEIQNQQDPIDENLSDKKLADKQALDSKKASESEQAKQTNLDELLAQPWDDDRQIKPEHKFDSPEDKNAEEPKVIEVIKVAELQTQQSTTNTVKSKIASTVDNTAIPKVNSSELKSATQSDTQTNTQTDTKTATKTIRSDDSQTQRQTVQSTQSTNKLMDNAWFLAQAPTGAMVQLAGLSEKRVLDGYLQRHQLKDSARIYQSIRNGKPWYVVTLGPFASMSEARQAIGQLSEVLQSSRPWAKSIKAIQLEIINANN